MLLKTKLLRELKKRKKARGFTLVELVLVIAILGVLAVIALPNLFDISLTAARSNSMDASVAAVRSGLSLYGSNQLAAGNALTFPTLLETSDLADGTAASNTSPLFNQVLQNGVTAQWFKVDDDCYAYDTNGNGSFDDGTDAEFQYVTANGTFLGVASCG